MIIGQKYFRYTVPVSIIGGGKGVTGENRRPAEYIKLSIHIITNVYEFESHSWRGVYNTTYIATVLYWEYVLIQFVF